MLRADDELPVVLGRLILAFDCIGNLKLMLMRSKARERGLLSVPEDHRGSSKTTKLLFEAVASAVSLCALGTERNSSQPGRRCQLKGNTSSMRAMTAGYQTRSTRSTATPASSIPSCCCCSSLPSSSGLL